MTFSCKTYAQLLVTQLASTDWQEVELLAEKLRQIKGSGQSLYICGNGGSAGNAQHLANDFIYGVSPKHAKGINAEALSANASVITCLGNDIGYSNIFSRQIEVKAKPGDVLLVLSGSGNSENIIHAIHAAKAKSMFTVAILGYSGGQAKSIVDLPIHFEVNDMQIAEDLQLVVGHMLMRMLCDESE